MIRFLLCFFMVCFSANLLAQTPPAEKAVKKVKKVDKSKAKLKKKKKKKSKKEEEEELMLVKKQKAPVYKQAPALMYHPIVRNGKKLTGSITSKQGFRICIYDGNKREEAFQIKREFTKVNVKMRSYMVYNRPYYKIKVGDFENKKVAQKEHKKLLEKYPHSFITPDIVTIKSFEVKRNIPQRRRMQTTDFN